LISPSKPEAKVSSNNNHPNIPNEQNNLNNGT
jgi:hypothetical protein